MNTLIDPDFHITDKLRSWADEKVPQVDIDAETEKFVDYWLSTGKLKANWDATWRMWMRRDWCQKKPVERRTSTHEMTDEQWAKDREDFAKQIERFKRN